jgi:hypothetical protein
MPGGVLVVGNSGNRRVHLFAEAARGAGFDVRVAPWIEVIARPEVLVDDATDEPRLVRIDAWGEDTEVERALLRRGAAVGASPRIVDPSAIDEATAEHGRIVSPRQAHDGVLAVLDAVATVLETRASWRVMQPIAAIRTAFDKAKTHALAASLGLPVPRALPRVGSPEELVDRMAACAMTRAYVKVGCTSSASCLALVERAPQGVSVVTSVEVDGPRFYNSLVVRRYARPHLVDQVLGLLLGEGAHVEEAIDKLPMNGRHADVRIVAVPGAAPFAVVRTSRVPITNLHLGAVRGDVDAYRRRLPAGAWDAALDHAETLARALGAWHLGVDVAFDRASGLPFVLEANAFGDLLPGVERGGESIYACELRVAQAGLDAVVT